MGSKLSLSFISKGYMNLVEGQEQIDLGKVFYLIKIVEGFIDQGQQVAVLSHNII